MSEEESSIVELNVGGVFYTTTMKTLKWDESSLLKEILESKQIKQQLKDSKDKLFIDRDGLLFRYVLDYMRTRQLILPENFAEKRRLKCEAEYYKLNGLIKLLNETDMNGQTNRSSPNSTTQSSANKPLAPPPSSPTPAGSLTNLKRSCNGCIIVGYRGTFANGRDGLADVKFRKISRILVCGRVQLCREVFGDTLNESRDPDHGVSDRYTSRYFLKHTFLEQAFDTLIEANFKMVCAAATGTNSTFDKDTKGAADNEENKWLHYNEFVFVRNI